MKYEGRKHIGEINYMYVRARGVTDCKSKERGKSN